MAAHDAASIGGAGPRRVDQRLLQILQVVALLLIVFLVLTRPEGISLLLLSRRREVDIVLHVADGGGGGCLGYAPVASSLILNLGDS